LSGGGGGVVEIRNAIEKYTEKSPLYGFIQYRRRKVLLKYIPEGISRLLQGTIITTPTLGKWTKMETCSPCHCSLPISHGNFYAA
jgi:hypothetical protein